MWQVEVSFLHIIYTCGPLICKCQNLVFESALNFTLVLKDFLSVVFISFLSVSTTYPFLQGIRILDCNTMWTAGVTTAMEDMGELMRMNVIWNVMVINIGCVDHILRYQYIKLSQVCLSFYSFVKNFLNTTILIISFHCVNLQ